MKTQYPNDRAGLVEIMFKKQTNRPTKRSNFVHLALTMVMIAATFVVAPTNAPAQESQLIKAEGFGAAKNKLRARDDAIQDALRRAVEQGVGTFVDAGTITENFELIADKVLSQAGGYVRTYNILEEGLEENDSVYRVLLEAEVQLGPIKNDLMALELLKQRVGYPRVMVIGTERADGGDLSSRTVATQIEQFLISKGFDLSDSEYTELGKERDVQLAFDDYSKAQALGQRFGKEVVVVYDADSDYSGGEVLYGMQFERYRAAVTARIIKVDTAALMGSVNAVSIGGAGGRKGGARRALENAGRDAASKVFDQIVKGWERDVDGGTRLELVVSGIKFADANTLYNELQEMRGINSVSTPEMARDVVIIRMKGNVQGFRLAQKVSELFPDIEIEEVTANRVKARGGVIATVPQE